MRSSKEQSIFAPRSQTVSAAAMSAVVFGAARADQHRAEADRDEDDADDQARVAAAAQRCEEDRERDDERDDDDQPAAVHARRVTAPPIARANRPAPATRPAQRCGICWTAQPLPSGSRKKTNEPHGNSWTSPASTPRDVSSAWAARMSGTTSCSPC